MKLYAPRYYKKFKCIADKCEHSCCVGWEIDIDNDTMKKYQKLKGSYATVVRNSICTEDTPHFKLGEGDRCPHLDERGLCKIILNVGEEYLSDICREHPRFYNYTDVCEVGIGMSCPEAARIILSSLDYDVMEEIGEVNSVAEETEINGRARREEIFKILKNTSIEYREKREKIYNTYSIDKPDDKRMLGKLDALEYLDVTHKDMFMSFSSKLRPTDKDEYLERFLAYFIFRHCTESYDEEDFRVRLAFCLFCESLFASLICSEKAETLPDISRIAGIISEEIEYSEDNTYNLMV